MSATCTLCSFARPGEHEPWCAHFLRGPDAGGDPAEWSTLWDAEAAGAALLESNRVRVAQARGDSAERTWRCQHGSVRHGYATPTASCERRAISPCDWQPVAP